MKIKWFYNEVHGVHNLMLCTERAAATAHSKNKTHKNRQKNKCLDDWKESVSWVLINDNEDEKRKKNKNTKIIRQSYHYFQHGKNLTSHCETNAGKTN